MKIRLSKGWKMEILRNVADVVMGQSPPSSTYNDKKDGLPFFQGKAEFGKTYPRTIKYCSEPIRIAKRNDILMSVRAPVGPVNLSPGECCFGRGLCSIRAKKGVLDQLYLFFYLRSIENIISNQGQGSTFGAIGRNSVEEIDVPYPTSLESQKQIVSILEKVEKAKELRKEADELTNEFLKAIFLEMFGDPSRNPKQWEIVKFSKIGELARGKSKHRPRNDPKLLGGKYPLIQTGDVANSKGYVTKFTQTYSELGLKQSKMWHKGTLCITIAANIARTGILTFDACFPDSIVGFTPNNYTNIEYIQHWLSFLQKALEENAPESAQKNINLEILENLNVPLPPITLQNEFSKIVKSVEQMKEYQEHSKEYFENMFNVLIQKSFKGELVC